MYRAFYMLTGDLSLLFLKKFNPENKYTNRYIFCMVIKKEKKTNISFYLTFKKNVNNFIFIY